MYIDVHSLAKMTRQISAPNSHAAPGTCPCRSRTSGVAQDAHGSRGARSGVKSGGLTKRPSHGQDIDGYTPITHPF